MIKKIMGFGVIGLLASLLTVQAEALAAGVLVKSGMRGDQVKEVQLLLVEHEFLEQSDVDGICGRKTTAAIHRFQKLNGLTVDGICGQETFDKLKAGGKKADKNSPVEEKGIPLYVFATAYSAYDPGNGRYTATGTLVRHGEIAVDPSVIPLGTRVYIPGYGEAIAEDTGGAINGNTIDIAFDSHEEAIAFGSRYMEIYILESP